MKPRLTLQAYYEGILQSNRVILAQTITLIESDLAEDQHLANQLLDKIADKTGNSIRIGITGVPGVGKSTFIESLGLQIADSHLKIAVLTIDPSSQFTKGSILADKTRMEKLSQHPNAFIRPSATGSTLGGVANHTRETILLCEAAGFDVILIETVGVGQSEVQVKNMVDCFLLLMLAGAGDELQGMKKGIMEMADIIAITKADGKNVALAEHAQQVFRQALKYLTPRSAWMPEVVVCSSLNDTGISAIWDLIKKFEKVMKDSNKFYPNRSAQQVLWLEEKLIDLIQLDFQQDKVMFNLLDTLKKKVTNLEISVNHAAQQLFQTYQKTSANNKF